MQKCLVCLVCAFVVSQAHAWDPLNIQNADSPDGKYVLEAVATSESTCRVDVKSKADGKVVGQMALKDYYANDRRYSISAVWKEDSAAFALNIEQGRDITSCRVFVEDRGSWKEVGLPERQIAKLRKDGNKEGGKEVDYLFASGWLPEDEIKLTYAGNKLAESVLIAHLIRAGRPRLDFVKIVPPKVEPKPKYDYENYVFAVLAGGSKGSKDGAGSGRKRDHLRRISWWAGKLDGETKSARFAFPWDLALDREGNLYVIDGWAVRKIDTHAMVSTLAGSLDQAGSTDGTGSAARFSGLSSVAVSPAGNLSRTMSSRKSEK
jgi:hypothetical protein